YNRQTSKCSAYPDALNPNGYLEYKPNVDILYIEKVCISDLVLPLSCDEIFRRIPQHVLFGAVLSKRSRPHEDQDFMPLFISLSKFLGHASEIVTAASEEECIRECILAKVKRNIQCRSLLHYSDVPSSNCILNVQTRLTRPEYFVPELDEKVDYVQIPECAKKLGGLSNGVGSVESEWTEWTSCDQKTSIRRRERLCTDCLERVQMQPCFSNENFSNALGTFIEEQQEPAEPPRAPHSRTSTKNHSTHVIPFRRFLLISVCLYMIISAFSSELFVVGK
ncbi:unnamed protein product, partial [Strongylus vulgaris]